MSLSPAEPNDASTESGVPVRSEENLAAFEEVLLKVMPFLSAATARNNVATVLHSLGVKTMSDLRLLKEGDLNSVMSVIDFRKMMHSISTSVDTSIFCKSKSKNEEKEYFLQIENIMSSALVTTLKGDEMLDRYTRRKVLNLVADDIYDNKKSVSSPFVHSVASHLVNKYPSAFGCLRDEPAEKEESALGVRDAMVFHIQYLKRKRQSEDSLSSTPKRHRFSLSQEYGLNPRLDSPNSLPEGESTTLQETKRKAMIEMYESGEINWKVVHKLMDETFPSQRNDINLNLNVDQLLQKWPFIGRHEFLQSHFSKLMSIDLESVKRRMDEVLPAYLDYFKFESIQTRKGAAKGIPDELNKIQKNLKSLKGPGNVNLIATALSIMTHLSIPIDKLFICFDETSTYDEVQASPLIPEDGKPVLAVLGKELLSNPQCFVVVDRRCLSAITSKVCQGILCLFMSYFIFKIAYSKQVAPLLEFLQRKIFKIDCPKGSRIERKKTQKGWSHSSPTITGKFTSLVKKFKEYRSKFVVDEDEDE